MRDYRLDACLRTANRYRRERDEARAEVATLNERLREEILKRGKVEREVERLTAEATRIVDQQAEQIVALRAEVERLRAELQHQAIDPLDWAMNSGDGTYKP